MTRLRKTFLPVALFASLLHGLALTGCGGGGSTPAGPSGGAQVRMVLRGLPAARAAAVARSASAGGAEVFVDGVSAGVTDAGGEIVLQLTPGIHSITVTSGGITSSPFEVTVAEGDSVTLEAEFNADGTLMVEQDIDHDGDYDDDDDDDADDQDSDQDDDQDEDADDEDDGQDDDADEDDDDEAGTGGQTDGTAVTR